MFSTLISARDLFWFTAGLLATLATFFLVAPWLGRGPSGTPTGSARPFRGALLGASVLAIAAVLLYARWGSPNQPSARAFSTTASGTVGGGTMADASSIDSVRARLERRLASQGGSSADWELLAQTYDFLGRSADAQRARTQRQLPPDVTGATPPAAPSSTATVSPPLAVTVSPRIVNPRIQALRASAAKARRARDYRGAVSDFEQLARLGALDAQGWADYADADASLQGGRLAGAPERMIAAALAQDPDNEKALWLEASLQHETTRYAQAVDTWRNLLHRVPAGSSDAAIFSANLAEDLGLSGAGAAGVTVAAGAAGGVAVTGEVAVAPALRQQLPAGATLFVIARALDAPAGPPVAVLRVSTSVWPVAFRLDDSLAMLPGHALSGAARVSVQARISRTGAALAAAGDLQSQRTQVDPRSGTPVHLLIDQMLR